MRFSERIGKVKPKIDIQIDYMDEDLVNSIWNIISIHLVDQLEQKQYLFDSFLKEYIDSLWFNHFKEPLDEIPISTKTISKLLRKRFFEWDYLNIYDFIDFTADFFNNKYNSIQFTKDCNKVLKRELSGFRFVNNILVPITNELEINEIEKAISDSHEKNFKGVNIHLSEALKKLSDKKNPDYRNSIKESISAIESICQQITGENNAELGKTLKKLKEILPIHGALEQGFLKLYGYTSDGDGIRHAMMEEDNLDQEDALYMLVSCSSFVNYLISKASKLNLISK